MLADPLGYQQAAVRKALDQANLRTRILLADAVGLGKTLEIGMILAELIRRGRGERILIVTPRHVLEQMQNEMWSRFAIPFVRLDTLGIQRVRQKLPATRNPFSYFKRVIISIDTLKSRQYLDHLRRQTWDAVVIDESHNVTNSEHAEQPARPRPRAEHRRADPRLGHAAQREAGVLRRADPAARADRRAPGRHGDRGRGAPPGHPAAPAQPRGRQRGRGRLGRAQGAAELARARLRCGERGGPRA